MIKFPGRQSKVSKSAVNPLSSHFIHLLDITSIIEYTFPDFNKRIPRIITCHTTLKRLAFGTFRLICASGSWGLLLAPDPVFLYYEWFAVWHFDEATGHTTSDYNQWKARGVRRSSDL